MADETPFEETQIGADGRRYKTEDIADVNAKLAKGESVDPLVYAPVGAVQEGSGTATGVQGDELSGDHSTVQSAPAEAKADEAGHAKHGRPAESSKADAPKAEPK